MEPNQVETLARVRQRTAGDRPSVQKTAGDRPSVQNMAGDRPSVQTNQLRFVTQVSRLARACQQLAGGQLVTKFIKVNPRARVSPHQMTQYGEPVQPNPWIGHLGRAILFRGG